MIKINLASDNMSLSEALNAALDVAGHVKGSTVLMEYQGVQFSIVMDGSLAIAPRIIEPRRIADFDDEVLINEYCRRLKLSQDFRNVTDPIVSKKTRNCFYGKIFGDAEKA